MTDSELGEFVAACDLLARHLSPEGHRLANFARDHLAERMSPYRYTATNMHEEALRERRHF